VLEDSWRKKGRTTRGALGLKTNDRKREALAERTDGLKG